MRWRGVLRGKLHKWHTKRAGLLLLLWEGTRAFTTTGVAITVTLIVLGAVLHVRPCA